MFKSMKDTLTGKTKGQRSEHTPLLQGHGSPSLPPELHHTPPQGLQRPAAAVSHPPISSVVRSEDAALREETKKVIHLAANGNLDLIEAARPLVKAGLVPRPFIVALGHERVSRTRAKEQSGSYVRRLGRLHKDKVDAHSQTLEKHIGKLKHLGRHDMAEQHEEHRKHLAILSNKASRTPDVVMDPLSTRIPLEETHREEAREMLRKEEGEVYDIMKAHGVARERQGPKGKEAASTSTGHGGAAS